MFNRHASCKYFYRAKHLFGLRRMFAGKFGLALLMILVNESLIILFINEQYYKYVLKSIRVD